MVHSMSSMWLKAGWRTVVLLTVLFVLLLIYLLPWALTAVIVLGLLVGWGISRLLESLS